MPKKPARILPFRESHSSPRDFDALLNVGPKSSAWLAEAGFRSVEEIRRLGPVGACRRLIERGRPVSVLMAYALEGALSGVHWNAISWAAKQHLRADFARMKREVASHLKNATASPVRRSAGDRSGD